MEQRKVLIVDDDPTTCNLLETILEMEEYQTTSVNDVTNEEIIPLLNEVEPNILILDFHLGAKESLRLLPTIRGNQNWQQLPVLMTSAIDRTEDCLAAGANGFILKPFNWQDVNNRVSEVMRNGKSDP